MELQISSEIQLALSEIGKKFDLELLILFGSRAKNKAKTNSDYDLAFLGRKLSNEKKMNLFDELQNLFKEKKFDLVDLSLNNSLFLTHSIARFGKCIYENYRGNFRKFKDESYINYLDAKPWLERQQNKFLDSSIE